MSLIVATVQCKPGNHVAAFCGFAPQNPPKSSFRQIKPHGNSSPSWQDKAACHTTQTTPKWHDEAVEFKELTWTPNFRFQFDWTGIKGYNANNLIIDTTGTVHTPEAMF